MAVMTRFAPCSVTAHGEHYWVGPPDGPGMARCLYCDVPLTMARMIPICDDCHTDLPGHTAKCKKGR